MPTPTTSSAPSRAYASAAASRPSRSSTTTPEPALVRCTPEQAAKTHARLERFVPFDGAPKASVLAVFARCCLATHPDFGLDPAASAAEAGRMAHAALVHPDRARLDLDPLLLASCHGLLADAGCEAPPLAELLAEVARSLASLPQPVRQLGRVRHLAALLAARGFPAAVEPAGREAAALARQPSRMLSAPGEVLADLADHLFADPAELGEDLTVMLALTALGELRNYRVDLGAKLLRLVVARGHRCEEADEGLNFVAVQRRRDGAYGFVNPLLPAEGGPKALELSFFLPMTVNAAWLFRTEAANRGRWRGARESVR